MKDIEGDQYHELFLKFLTDQSTAEEQAFLLNWIEADISNRKYFEAFESLWQLTAIQQTLTKVNVDDEWNNFRQALAEKQLSIIDQENIEQVLPETDEDKISFRKGRIYKLIIRTSIAASVLLVLALGWKFLYNTKSNETAPVIVKEGTVRLEDSLLTVVRHEVNTSGQPKRLLLQDGSVIILSDKSEVSFQEPFTGNQRNVTLIGKAYFNVATDKTKPFTVISGDISTTALGTEFTVTAFENANNITVRLYEGKVVIKPVKSSNLALKKDVYLLPGQEFIYKSKTANPKVKMFKLNEGIAPEEILNEELSRDLPSIPQNTKGSWYMFNNQPLADVLELLSEMYNVKIVYDKEDIKNISFTKQFNRTDSIEIILKEVSILNSLTITRKDNTFIISK
jgi:transmembrane sensor